MKKITLRSFEDEDNALFIQWLNKDYVLKWYHDPEDWLHEVNERNSSFSWIHHFIVMEGTVPIGFCQYYDCFDANDMEDWYTVTERGNTFSIDYLIGNEAYLGKGYGKGIVKLLTDTVYQVEQAKYIIVQPDEENHASNKILLANGYVFDKGENYYRK